MYEAVHFGDALDVHPGTTQSLDQGGQRAGPIFTEPHGDVATQKTEL